MLSKPKHRSSGETRHEKGGVISGIPMDMSSSYSLCIRPAIFPSVKIEELRLYDGKSVGPSRVPARRDWVKLE